MNSTERRAVFEDIIETINIEYNLIYEYDKLPHKYGEHTLYQTESHMIASIGENEKITITELANIHHKTTSACSQLVSKLRKKGFVKQIRNKDNNREYNLFLTEEGWKVYKEHEEFDTYCLTRTYQRLDQFTDEELKLYLAIQKEINAAFAVDVEESLKDN